jgi:rare lipoprotein A
MVRLAVVILIFILAAAVQECLFRWEQRTEVPRVRAFQAWVYARHQMHTGIASWYGPRFRGRKTANGEVFNQNKLTAAHRTLRLGTMVEVTNPRNGMSVDVRINDRGPYAKGRAIDLSRAAADRLGMRDAGLARVEIRTIHSLIK